MSSWLEPNIIIQNSGWTSTFGKQLLCLRHGKNWMMILFSMFFSGCTFFFSWIDGILPCGSAGKCLKLRMFIFQAFCFRTLSISSDDVNTSCEWPRTHWTSGLWSLGFIVTGYTLYSCYTTSVWEFWWDLLPSSVVSFRIVAQSTYFYQTLYYQSIR